MTIHHSEDRFAGFGVCFTQGHAIQQDKTRISNALMNCMVAIALLIFAMAGSALAAPVTDKRTPEEKAVAEAYEEFMQEMLEKNGARAENHGCAIIVGRTGTMHINPEANEISSSGWGGQPGEAQIVATNSSFDLSMDPPLGFSLAPPKGNDAIVFSGSFSGFGATNFSQTPGNTKIRVKKGMTSITANLVATKTSGTFPAGQYRAELTLRCE